MAKRIICRNEDGVQVEFNYSFEPFFLVSVDGIYTVSNNVVTSENTMVDGSTYQGSTTKQRNIVITAQMERDYQANRDLLYKCFKPKSTGLLPTWKATKPRDRLQSGKGSTLTKREWLEISVFPFFARIRSSEILKIFPYLWQVGRGFLNGHTNFWKRKSRSRKERPKY